MEWKNYLPFLKKLIEANTQNIQKDIGDFVKDGSKYRNLVYGNELSLILLKGKNPKVTLNIGYPFPLLTKEIKNCRQIKEKSISAKFFLRGKPIRVNQRINLLSALSKTNPIQFREIGSMKEFRNLTKKVCKKYTDFSYFDPYTFVGDSFIGTYFIENFKEAFGLKLNQIYSNSYEHLKFAFDSREFNLKKIKPSKGLFIIGDFVDLHWDKTFPLIKLLLRKECSIIMLGRNIILENKNGFLNIFHLNLEDHLLKNQNIEDYMKSLLKPHLIPKGFYQRIKSIKRLNILINPFGSEEIKTIPHRFVLSFIESLLEFSPQSKITLVQGFEFLEYHKNWIEKIKIKLTDKDLDKKVEIKSYKSLSEIAKDISFKKIDFGLTTDTSISHLLNFLGIVNFSFFNKERWDPKSPQSLSSDSPLGFCRYYPAEIPIIFDKGSSLSLLEDTIKLIRHIKTKKKKINLKRLESSMDNLVGKKSDSISKLYSNLLNKQNLGWMNNLFNPEKITSELKFNKESEGLFYSAWKLNILGKTNKLK